MHSDKQLVLLDLLLSENSFLNESIEYAESDESFKGAIRSWIMDYASTRPHLMKCFDSGDISRIDFNNLNWKDVAALRIFDYLEHAGIVVQDHSIGNKEVVSDPFGQVFGALKHGEYEFRMIEGADEYLQVECLLAQFGLLGDNNVY